MQNKGITLIEVLIVIAILAVIFAVALPQLSDFKKTQSLRNTADQIVSLLNDARAKTLASEGGNYFNVLLEEDKATLFSGASFSESDPYLKEVTFEPGVILPSENIDLESGSDTVSFLKLSGDTNDFGEIIIEIGSDSSLTKTISILRTGVITIN